MASFEPMLTEEPAIDPISSIPWGYAFSPQRVVLVYDGVIGDLVGVVYKKLGTPYIVHVALFENPLLSNPVALSQRVCYRRNGNDPSRHIRENLRMGNNGNGRSNQRVCKCPCNRIIF